MSFTNVLTLQFTCPVHATLYLLSIMPTYTKSKLPPRWTLEEMQQVAKLFPLSLHTHWLSSGTYFANRNFSKKSTLLHCVTVKFPWFCAYYIQTTRCTLVRRGSVARRVAVIPSQMVGNGHISDSKEEISQLIARLEPNSELQNGENHNLLTNNSMATLTFLRLLSVSLWTGRGSNIQSIV